MRKERDPSKEIMDKFSILDEMHREVRGFINTALILKSSKYHFDYYPIYASPYAVNMAFACEISLKELLLLNGKPARGHKLYEDLFVKLPSNLKNEIQQLYYEECLVYIQKEKDIVDDRVFPGNKVEDCLQAYQNAFVEWRYAFEQKILQVPHDDLACATRAIRKATAINFKKFCDDNNISSNNRLSEPEYLD